MIALCVELEEKAKVLGLNAYVGFERSGAGVLILIKDNIQVKGWSATAAKCPRCWRFTSTSEDCACERCAKVVGA